MSSNRYDAAINHGKYLCGMLADRPAPMSMAKHICVLQEALQDLLRELDDALAIADDRGYQRGYDEGYEDGKEEGYHKRALEYPA